jgi:hypothetical protein
MRISAAVTGIIIERMFIWSIFGLKKWICPNQASRPPFRKSVKRRQITQGEESRRELRFDKIYPRAHAPLQGEKAVSAER